ncbi:hypothetical protein LCGC14_2707140, partial [marine sediment metagenome]
IYQMQIPCRTEQEENEAIQQEKMETPEKMNLKGDD